MKRKSTKIISMVLSLMMIFCTIPAATMSVSAATNKTQAEAISWCNTQINKYLDYDGNGAWCVDLIAYYLRYLGANSFIGGNGCDYAKSDKLKKLPSGWKYIGYYDGCYPNPGDIIVWSLGSGSNPYGHVAIGAYGSNSGSWKMYSQNPGATKLVSWAGGRYCGGNGMVVSGFIRPSFATTSSVSVITNDATNITNDSAIVSGVIKNGSASYMGLSLWDSSNKFMGNSKIAFNVSPDRVISANISQYEKNLAAGSKYYYQIYAVFSDHTGYGAKKSFTTTNIKPNIPTLKINNKDVAKGDTISISWGATANSKYYYARLYDEYGNKLQEKQANGTSAAFDGISQEGTYYATIASYNNAGTKGESAKQTITVHPDVTVKFVDYDGAELCEPQTIGYNKSATAPASPNRRGYTFDKWDNAFTNVKEDTTVTATYTINKYTVKFVDDKGNPLKTETVEFQKGATAPEFTPADGYKLIGWDKDFSSVEEDMTVTADIDWYNKNYYVYSKIDSAARIMDSDDESNEGYDIDISIVNNNAKVTRGRVIVALMTEQGKLVESTESAAFTVNKNDTKAINVFIPSDKAAKIVKTYVVSQYDSVIPIANSVTSEINQDQAFTNWSTEEPPEDAYKTESRTEYRYKTKSTTTSYETSLAGWTQSGSSWVKSGSGNIDYVSSWPSGFNRSHWIYSSYNKTPKTASETATTKTTVSTSTINYIYYHWCRGTYTSGPINRRIDYNYSSTYKTFHAFVGGWTAYNSSASAFQYSNGSVCKDTYWWNSANPNLIPLRRCSYTDYRKLFNYYKWSDFSDWSTTAKTADDNTIVETRTVYRYLTNESVKEDTSGVERTISGTLGSDNAGKEVTLFIYKSLSNSDYSNEYVAQTALDENGDYSFTFKLREEPTVETGDYTVELGLEGASTGVLLDPIKAPKKTYTVKFYGKDGNVISEQTVAEGENAVLPDEADLQTEGYRFLNWTESNRNIRENLDIYPNYELKEFTVVFVDWTSKYVSMEKFKYGEVLTTPELGEVAEDQVISWDVEDGTVVKDDMIVTTKIEDKKVNAEILGYDDKVISSQSVKYDTAVDIPDIDNNDDYIFLGWKIKSNSEDTVYDLTDAVITDNVTIYPEYVFANTVEMPTANIESGEYDSSQTIELTCATENAVIYYTTDGTDPATSETALEYSEAFTLDKSCQLRFIAMSLGMNDSGENSLLLAINTGKTAYHILNIYDNTANSTYGYSALVKDGFTIDINDFKNLYEGYTFDGFYYDLDYTEEFVLGVETVTESLTLYAKYTPKTYTVTFKDYDGTVVDTQKVAYCESAVAPEMTRDGYVFIGWDNDNYLSVSSDLEVTAKYIIESEYATVSLNRTKLSIEEGKMFTLKATISPEELSDKELSWESDNTGIATVDENGVVIAVAPGTAKITVTVVETNESASCDITVSGDSTKSIYLNLNSYLDVDSQGYLRRLDPERNSVSLMNEQFKSETLKFFDINGDKLSDDSEVGTGTIIKMYNENDEVIDEMTCIMTGDYNGDGLVNNKDVVFINQYVIEKCTADTVQMIAMDVNGDGNVNNRDASMLARYLVGKEKLV